MADKRLQTDFLTILNQCQGILVRLCWFYSDRSSERANDLYQEIVCNLWDSFPRFRGDSKPGTWVYRVAINTVYMQYRTRRRLPKFVSMEGLRLEEVLSDTDDELVVRLYQLIDKLDADERELISLYLARVSQREIAATLCISENAVNHRIKRIKQKLKKMNEDEE